MYRFTSSFFALSIAILGCAANSQKGDSSFGGSDTGPSSTGTLGAGAGATTTDSSTGAPSASTGSLSGTVTSSGSGSGGGGSSLIYAHTDTTLYTLDPTSSQLSLTMVGDFDCVGGNNQDNAMTDVAVNQMQDIWAVSQTAVHSIQILGTTAHCASSIPLNNPNKVSFYALTFAPAGVLDPMKEVLVAGNTKGELWAIDGNGNLSQHGTFGTVPSNDGNGHSYQYAGKTWELSGDIVFLANNGNPVGFATVRDCPSPPSTSNCDADDTLLEIDVSLIGSATTGSVTKAVRGQIVKGASCNDGTSGSYGSMYGIAAWNDKVYGFSRKGNLVEIDTNDGSACLVQAYASDKFAGAGVTTLAPVMVPPPK